MKKMCVLAFVSCLATGVRVGNNVENAWFGLLGLAMLRV